MGNESQGNNKKIKLINIIVYIMCLTIIIAFFRGALHMIGIAPGIPKSAILFLTIFAAILSCFYFKINYRSFSLKFILFFLMYTFIVFLSYFLNNSDLKETLTFYHSALMAALSFLIFANLPLKYRQLLGINKTFEFLIVFQIFFIVFKFFVWGRSEGIAGTISFSGGAINTVFPLLAISYFLSKYIYYKKKGIYLLFCIGFLFMGLVGEKRAIFFFFPIILFVILYLKNRFENVRIMAIKNLRIIIASCAVIILTFYFGLRLTPTLNPEHSTWGSFDIDYVVKYAIDYNYRPNREYVRGRMAGLIQSFKYISNSEIKIFLFGSGPDQLINYRPRDGTEKKFGISNAGAITGLATYLISVGIVGSTLIFGLYFIVGREVYKTIKKNYNNTISLVHRYRFFVVCATFVFALDFIFYTRAFVQSSALNFFYFIIAGISVNKKLILPRPKLTKAFQINQ